MQNVLRLEELKAQVEVLWKRILEAKGPDQARVRSEYQQKYEAYRRQKTWVEALN